MKMKKRLKIFFLILFVLTWSIYFFTVSYWLDELTWIEKKIEDCINSKSKRDITDYVCIEWTREEITYQIVFDEEFTKIDNEIEEYLNNLEKDKDKYFWANKEKTFIEAIDEIIKKLSEWGDYYLKYNKLCKVDDIISKAQFYLSWSTNIHNALPFFDNSICIKLAKTKLYFYKQVAYDILLLNKWQVRKDAQKTFEQQQRTKYDSLIDKMKYNENYMDNILHKWPWKIEKAH